jgi:hypothetical protein
MVHLSQMGGIEEDMLEFLREYFKVKKSEYTKKERDLLGVTIKKILAKELKAIHLIDYLVE